MTSTPAASATSVKTAAAYAAIIGGIALAAMDALIVRVLPFGASFLTGSLAAYGVATFFIITRIGVDDPQARFGLANALTWTRLVLVCVFAGVVAATTTARESVSPGGWWFFFYAATVALILDGCDGFVARRHGTASTFGGHFDMEVDAFFILLLSILAFMTNKAGAWVLISGALRYLYVIAGWFVPQLAAPMPAHWRRKFIAAVQGAALTALLAPIMTPPLSAWTAAAALALLIYSFTVDVAWLMRKAP